MNPRATASDGANPRLPASEATENPVATITPLTQSQDLLRNAAAINEALLLSGLHQHELTATAVALNAQLAKEIAERKIVEAALHEANRRLADQAKELERVVAERTEKLRETVGELEGFSYSIAHDMRAPLRGMQGFARILLDEYSHKLEPEAQTLLEQIASSASRMDLLIQDVFNYTQVLQADACLVPVDMNRLVRDIMAIYPDWQPPKAEIQVEGILPFVLGHTGFLTQCISNLLSNAVKFVAPGVTPRVRIWAEDRVPPTTPSSPPFEKRAIKEKKEDNGPIVRVWFENNGIGIAPQDHARIFCLFERIHPADQFEGTGIGLTIARKAAHRMGGRIDFESEPGNGSKFWLELKKAPEQREPVPKTTRRLADSA